MSLIIDKSGSIEFVRIDYKDRWGEISGHYLLRPRFIIRMPQDDFTHFLKLLSGVDCDMDVITHDLLRALLEMRKIGSETVRKVSEDGKKTVKRYDYQRLFWNKATYLKKVMEKEGIKDVGGASDLSALRVPRC